MGTLELSFYGPFVYLLNMNPIRVYAPICPGHVAGMFSSESEFAIPGRCRRGMSYTYALQSSAIKPGNATVGNPDRFWDAAGAGGTLTANQDAPFFCLTVPIPQAIYGLNSDDSEIVDPAKSPTYKLKTYATAVRFFYDCDFTTPVTLTPPWPVSSAWVFDFLPQGSDHADIQLRYAASEGDDPDHAEAKDCFSRAAALLSLSHWLSYDQTDGGTHLRAGNDCRAPILALR